MKPAGRVLLAVIVLGAAALRFWGLDLALPNVDGRPDEREMLAYTAGFPSGDLNPRWFVYPNLFMYTAWLWIDGLLALRRLWTPTPGYAEALRDALPVVLLAGRALSALAGTLTVLLVYRIASRDRGPARGLVAAALLATCWLHVRDSHFLKTEALLALGVLATVGLLARFAETGRRTHAVLAGIAIGVSMGIKYPAVFLLVAAWAADLLRTDRPAGLRRLLPSTDLLVLGLVAALAFVAACPYLVLDFGRTRDTAAFLGLALYAERPGVAAGDGLLASTVAWLRSRAFGYHVTTSLRYGCGLLPTLTLPVALAWAARRREPLLVLAATVAATLFLAAGASPVRLARYVTPMTPLLAILIAELVVALAARTHTPRARTAVTVALTAALGAGPLWAAVQGDRIAAREDTRVLATEWMRHTLPPHAKVSVLGTVLLPQGAPKLPPGVAGSSVRPSLDAFAADGVTHVVTHEHPLQFSRLDPAVMAQLAPSLQLVADFSPFAGPPAGGFEGEDAYYIPFFHFAGVRRPGPHVRVYRLTPRPS
jgi:4-amino-4-deoxy-L-arabinose transferase-like glycosyltransferase